MSVYGGIYIILFLESLVTIALFVNILYGIKEIKNYLKYSIIPGTIFEKTTPLDYFNVFFLMHSIVAKIIPATSPNNIKERKSLTNGLSVSMLINSLKIKLMRN